MHAHQDGTAYPKRYVKALRCDMVDMHNEMSIECCLYEHTEFRQIYHLPILINCLIFGH